jgi:transposase
VCEAADQPIRDRLPRRWQHLHFLQFRAFIEARVPRVAFKRFAEDLKAHGGDPAAITDISMDMAAGFQAGAKAQCPQAAISFDHFHVAKLANTGLDEVRRAETKREPDLKGSRWGLLKSAEKWSFKQLTLLHRLQRSGLKTARAWRHKEALRTIYQKAESREQAEPMLRAWISWARRSRLPAFKRLGQTLRTHLHGILGQFESGLSNGFVPCGASSWSDTAAARR